VRRNTIWHLMYRDRLGPHYASLIAELNGLAASLAKAIDACGEPPPFSAESEPMGLTVFRWA
jgi:hypothetical protein